MESRGARMSRKHKDWTPAERKAAARATHAENRLAKLDSVILHVEGNLSMLKAERKRLKAQT
jgi:hypothetical protein